MNISFIIPAYNEESYIRQCLDAIIHEIGGRPGYEVIVVDNNSNDRTCDIVTHDYPAVTLIHEPQRGANRAREAGPGCVLSNSFGFGGTNATIVLEKA